MARDTALLAAAEAGAPPVLRLFAFTPPGITLGVSQDPARELDLARCAHEGVAWAVRPTGGRAIFHDQEWTYSLAASRDDPEWGGSLAETYARAS
ncbi:MAG TPA: octanoyltransferase, partial [Candidatus Eisenbacteria bacterium]|nr:octanoyltransferase [Candidatus Eisenbacteria bacterium]